MADESADQDGEQLGEPLDSIAEVETPLELDEEDAREVAELGSEAHDNLDVSLGIVLRDLARDPPVVKYASVAALDQSLDDLKAFTERFREVTEDMVEHPNGGDHD